MTAQPVPTTDRRPISVMRRDLDSIRAEHPLLARDMAERGYVATVTLAAGVPATMAYETRRGALVYVSGSRALLARYHRLNPTTT